MRRAYRSWSGLLSRSGVGSRHSRSCAIGRNARPDRDGVPEAAPPAGKATLRSLALNTFGILAAYRTRLGRIPPRLSRRRYQRVARRNRQSNPLSRVLPGTAPELGDVGSGDCRQLSAGRRVPLAVGVAPSDVFAAGVDFAQKVMSQMSIWAPAASVGLIIAGLVIEVCFALIAAFMVLALVESYLIISMGVIIHGVRRDSMDEGLRRQHGALHRCLLVRSSSCSNLLVSIGDSLITSWAATFQDVTAASLCILGWLLDRHAGDWSR